MDKLWCDLKTDKEKLGFLESGKAWEGGIIAKSISAEIAERFDNTKFISAVDCLQIVDICFNAYASSFRKDAELMARGIIEAS